MDGKNFVELQGVMRFPELKETRNGNKLFKGKVAVPFTYQDRATGEVKQGSNYYPVIAWGDLADDMGSLRDGSGVLVQGVLQSRSYEGNCKSCAAPEKKYWTDVLVDNFVEV